MVKVKQTNGDFLYNRFLPTQTINPSKGEIAYRFPVELVEKVGADYQRFTLVAARGRAAQGARK